MSTYSIKEIFPTMQGEGSLAGTPAVFVRFAGCNLWSGLDSFRDKGSGECAKWCDTDFFKGEKLESDSIIDKVKEYTKDWDYTNPLVVITGGEPFLQLSQKKMDLIEKLVQNNFKISVETNGTISNAATDLISKIGHITMSPKMLWQKPKDLSHIKLKTCTDLKIIVPTLVPIEEVTKIVRYKHLYLQPKDTGDEGRSNVNLALELACRFAGRVSIQSHKMVGLR